MLARRLLTTVARTVTVRSVARPALLQVSQRASLSTVAAAAQGSSRYRMLGAACGMFAAGLATWHSMRSTKADAVPYWGKPGTLNERTFIAVKPDGVQRGLVGEIIRRFEARGYKLVAIKLLHPSLEQAKEHYFDLRNKPFYNGLCQYFSSGPIVCMVWEGKNVIKGGRLLVGATNPDDSLPGSIRGDLCIEVGRNIIHGSDGPDSAQDEIKLWFKEPEVTGWAQTNQPWIY